LLSIASCVVTFVAQHRGGMVMSFDRVPLETRLVHVPANYVVYLLKLLWPSNLVIYYPLAPVPMVALIVAVIILIGTSTAVWLVRKNHPYLLVGWLWFLGTLVPVIGLVQVGAAAMADRYTYFPAIGIFLALVLGLAAMARRFHWSKAVAVPAAAALGLLLWLTHVQVNYWRDDIALFSHALAVTKENPTSHLNLGYAYLQFGRKEDAIAEYRTALRLEPDNIKAHNNLATLLDDAGHPELALAEFEAALKMDPHYAVAHNNYGTLLVELGRLDEATQHYSNAMSLNPDDWHSPFLLGKALLKSGRDGEAIPYLQKALQLNPNSVDVLVYLAQVLATDADPKIRDGRAAYLLALKANAISGGIQPVMLDTLGMAFAETGRFDDARQAVSDAIAVAKQSGVTNNVPLMEHRLELYGKQQPFHQTYTNNPVKTLPKQ